MSEENRQAAAQQFEQAAEELELAARHLRVTARHFREGDVPRACAHAFAGYGHMCNARRHVDERAVIHAAKSVAD